MSPSGTASWSSGDRLATVATRGRPTAQVVKPFLEAGYGERQILEIVLAVSVKTISNYVNHLFDTPVDAAFKTWGWKAPRQSAA